ncbi:hypothetical protein LTR66_013965, partial [Elasticomyces elasticus]
NSGVYNQLIANIMSSLTQLTPAAEEALHAKRLFPHEERKFRALSKRLLAPTNPINSYLRRRIPVEKPALDADEKEEGETGEDGDIDFEDAVSEDRQVEDEAVEPTPIDTEQYLKELKTFHANIVHDCSSLTASLAQIQLLFNANTTERNRYSEQVVEITGKCQDVKDETIQLRAQLGTAKVELERRRDYDELAEKVLYEAEDEETKTKKEVEGNRKEKVKAKTREELRLASEKLQAEIQELENEQEELADQWHARREALEDVIVAGQQLRRVIRGEPDHADTGDADEEEADGEHEQRREDEEQLGVPEGEEGGSASHAGTPRHPGVDGGASPMPEVASSEGGRTPIPGSLEASGGSGLRNEVVQEADVPDIVVGHEDMDTS